MARVVNTGLTKAEMVLNRLAEGFYERINDSLQIAIVETNILNALEHFKVFRCFNISLLYGTASDP
jgi:hypothetical protein